MGKLTGTVLIVAGIALAAYTVSSSSQREATPQMTAAEGDGTPAPARAHEASTAPDASTVHEPSAARASDAPLRAPPQESPAAPAAFSAPAPNPALSPVATEAALAAAPVPMNETAPRLPIGDAKAGPPLSRPTLVREIQRQLKRIGCYRGDLNGVWTVGVRDAMKAVTERVNASLPIDQPDPVLLAIVQSQEPGTCSAS